MTTSVNVMDLKSAAGQPGLLGGRPIVNKRNGVVTIKSARGLTINSTLRKDEWEELDRRVVMAAVPPLVILNYLVGRGLTRTLGGLGTMVAQYNRISEMTPANATLRGHASGEKDLVDVDLAGVPVPVIFKEFEIDERLLLSSRRLGDGLDVTNAAAAARVVAEKAEDMLINGDASINLNGATIYGLTNHPDINTGTAASYGGGDWGTASNITPTIAGMISAAQNDGYYGPYALWAAPTQFNQASMVFFDDGSGDTPRDRILRLAGIQSFEQSPQLADGEVLLVTLSDEVVQIATVPGFFPITNREWMTGDGMLNSFKALSVYTPIVKSAHDGKSGIVLATAA
jgi:uncharacterized linocin/CFP29 family protein